MKFTQIYTIQTDLFKVYDSIKKKKKTCVSNGQQFCVSQVHRFNKEDRCSGEHSYSGNKTNNKIFRIIPDSSWSYHEILVDISVFGY